MTDHPDPQVPERARPRRQNWAKYKLAILAEYVQLDRDGKGALLRREGLYTALNSEWRNSSATGPGCARGAVDGEGPSAALPSFDPGNQR